MAASAEAERAGWCDACMGSGRCWVCAGCGTVERRIGTAECPSCAATGICRYCTSAAAVPAQVSAAEPVTIRLDPPLAAAAADRCDTDGGAATS